MCEAEAGQVAVASSVLCSYFSGSGGFGEGLI